MWLIIVLCLNQVVLISGETGCGKTTQVIIFLFLLCSRLLSHVHKCIKCNVFLFLHIVPPFKSFIQVSEYLFDCNLDKSVQLL